MIGQRIAQSRRQVPNRHQPSSLARSAHQAIHTAPALSAGQLLTSMQVLRLQSGYGNQAVQRLLSRAARRVPGTSEPVRVQREDFKHVEKSVSAKAMTRLQLAQAAIFKVNNEILKYGAGNQAPDIRKTRGVSLHRTKVLQDKKDVGWRVIRDNAADEKRVQPEPARRAILLEYYGASVCDDFGYATFDYLRQIASGQRLTRAATPGLSHAYVIIGDLKTDAEDDLVVADPWPTSPQACTWPDFFGYADKTSLTIKNSMVADGSNIHNEVLESIEILQEPEEAQDVTADAQMASIVNQLGNERQLRQQPGGKQKAEELKQQLVDSMKFDDAAIQAFTAYVAANHKSRRSRKIRDYFQNLQGEDTDDRKDSDLKTSLRSKAVKLLLEFASTPKGMAALANGFIEHLIALQPDKFVWAHRSTLLDPQSPIFYSDKNWSPELKEMMLQQFEADLKSNQHVSDDAAAQLFPE
jgi:hypothetical protein